MGTCRIWFVLVIAAGVVAAIGVGPVPIDRIVGVAMSGQVEEPVDFNRDIQPLLSDRCFKCHGPDEAAREQTGGLRFDSFEGATAELDGGAQALVPGDPAGSLIMQRLTAADERKRMPPADSNLTMSDEEIKLIERWIADGGAYTKHWSFVAPERPPVPLADDDSWSRNEIDAFILERLDRAGFEPSPEADRSSLIRRLSLDLTGLPPTVEEVDAFLADDAPGAYERVVDRLLASPHYGERMALMWLDVARYADTNGYHHDNERSMWPWRDWVIEAFNSNKPYDDFVVEQIGGDLLPDAARDQIIATGFNRNHPMTDEGGAIDAEYRVEYAADRVETMSNAFLALTMQCTRCHDHKYDPVTQDDYFSLFAFFNSSNERGLYDRGQGDRDKAFPPFIKAPTVEQQETLATIEEHIAEVAAKMEGPLEGLDEQQGIWESTLRTSHNIAWATGEVVAAASSSGSTLEVLDDGSVLATGENPATDIHTITLRTDATQVNMIVVEAMGDPSLFEGRVGRAPNGNAVLSGIEVEAVSVSDPSQVQTMVMQYAWADIEQRNGDFDVMNALRADDPLGWAVAGHLQGGGRIAMFVADEPVGFEGGTDLRVRLRYETQYGQHVLGRVRLRAGAGESVRSVMPIVERDWFIAAPFPAESGDAAYETAFGPESVTTISLAQTFGKENKVRWAHRGDIRNGAAVALNGERRAFYLGRSYFSPEPRQITLGLGSDDAIRVFLNGAELLGNNTRRGVAPDQETVTVDLPAGESAVVVKVVNEGGPGGFYAGRLDEEPLHIEPIALVDEAWRSSSLNDALRQGYRERLSPAYRALREERAALEAELVEAEASIPNVMVMEELPEPRQTYVLARGLYDLPDESRPVERTSPLVLNAWPEEAPRDRHGLGLWLVDASNPLTSRVAVNRFWQTVFGLGIVKTVDDFGVQGAWPSHPALLDWLAVDFRENGWDVKRLIKQIVMSSTYRQSSAWRDDLAEADPENQLLGRSSRMRLPAEVVRDSALAMSGLLDMKVGGPSVRPYQPDGLWRERSMPNSNTRIFARDSGADLYRRGMYTFWKRSAPPPQMANFDAPAREYCVAKRSLTNTPMQALTLMNDETYLEIARALAQRAALEVPGEDAVRTRLGYMFKLATAREPDMDELDVLDASYRMSLRDFERSPGDAEAVLAYGDSPRSEQIRASEHAALMMVASIVLNLDETITRE